jgi:YfiR/HmsC-like
MRNTSVFIFSVSLVSFLSASAALAQSQEKVYALMIVSFAKGIQWPDFPANQKFIIGVLGYPPLAAELSASTAASKIGNRSVEIKEYSQVEEISNCQILFVPAYKARQLTQLLSKLGKSPVLIVTNKPDLIQKGSDINFVLNEGKLRYELNSRAIESRGMKISAAVKGRGILVDM